MGVDGQTGGSPVEESRNRLRTLAGATVSIMNLACAGVVLEPNLDDKIGLAQQAWRLAQSAEILMTRLPGLKAARSSVTQDLPTVSYWPDGAEATRIVAAALRGLRARMAESDRLTNALSDEPTQRTLQLALAQLTKDLKVDDGESAPADPGDGGWPFSCLGAENVQSAALPSIPEWPARAPNITHSSEYRGPSLAKDLSNRVEFLHAVAMGVEVCAAEACAAMIAGHPDSPWPLRYDLARQLNDEARHFLVLKARIEELGGYIGRYPVEYDVWHRFRLGDNLAEHIMIEQRIGESVGLDGGALAHAAFRAGGDAKTAELFDFINADEVTHVWLGNRWLAELIPDAERRLSLEAELRQRLADAACAVKTGLPVNRPDRLLAGYTELELAAREPAANDG